MFIKNCIIDRYTDKNKNRQCITSGIKHWGLSGYSSVLPRIKFGVTGQVCSPQSPTISYRRPLSATLTDHRADINRHTKIQHHTDRHSRHDNRPYCIFIFPTARKK